MNVRVWNIDKLKLESMLGPRKKIILIDVKYKKLDSWIVKEAAP